jgi:epoxide hydrolase-like predicted phosphatase
VVKFIYFDFGGVLVNYDNVFTKVCSDFEINKDEFIKFESETISRMDIGIGNLVGFWKKCVEKFKLSNADNYDLAKSWVSDYKKIKPVQDLINSLEGNTKMGIISNIPAEVWWAAYKNNWVPRIKYDQVLLSSDLGVVKPDSRIYEIAEEKTRVSPEEILFVDDKEENLVGPIKMGWKTLCFDQSKAEDEVLKIYSKIPSKLTS